MNHYSFLIRILQSLMHLCNPLNKLSSGCALQRRKLRYLWRGKATLIESFVSFVSFLLYVKLRYWHPVGNTFIGDITICYKPFTFAISFFLSKPPYCIMLNRISIIKKNFLLWFWQLIFYTYPRRLFLTIAISTLKIFHTVSMAGNVVIRINFF